MDRTKITPVAEKSVASITDQREYKIYTTYQFTYSIDVFIQEVTKDPEITLIGYLHQNNRSLLPSGGLMADVPCLDYSLDGCKGYPDDVQMTKHARRMHAWLRCARTSLGAHASPFGASSARF